MDECTDTCYSEINVVLDTVGRGRSGCASIYTRSGDDIEDEYPTDRFYLQVKLKKTLEIGQLYYFEMYAKLYLEFGSGYYYSNHVDMALDKRAYNNFGQGINTVLELNPRVESGLVADTSWVKIRGCFTAAGNEKYLFLGNFKDNSKTPLLKTGLIAMRPSYPVTIYLLDDALLVAMKSDFPRDTAICEGQNLVINAYKPNISDLKFIWQDGSSAPSYTTNQTGTYNVVAYNSALNCLRNDSITVHVLPNSRPNLSIDTTICRNKSLTILAGTARAKERVVWENGSTQANRIITEAGNYSAVVSDECASWQVNYQVKADDCELNIFVPNTFSPNNDGNNDDFKPYFNTILADVRQYKFVIYDRWGGLMFSTQNINSTWDGSAGNSQRKCVEGIYTWSLTVSGTLKEQSVSKQLSGDVLLLRQ